MSITNKSSQRTLLMIIIIILISIGSFFLKSWFSFIMGTIIFFLTLIIENNNKNYIQNKNKNEINAHLPMYLGLTFSMIGVIGSIAIFIYQGEKSETKHYEFILHIALSLSTSAYALILTRENLNLLNDQEFSILIQEEFDPKKLREISTHFILPFQSAIQELNSLNLKELVHTLESNKKMAEVLAKSIEHLDEEKLEKLTQTVEKNLEFLKDTRSLKGHFEELKKEMAKFLKETENGLKIITEEITKYFTERFKEKLITALDVQTKTLEKTLSSHYNNLQEKLMNDFKKFSDDFLDRYQKSLEDFKTKFIKTFEEQIEDVKILNKEIKKLTEKLDKIFEKIDSKNTIELLEQLNKNIIKLNENQEKQIKVIQENSLIYWLILLFKKIINKIRR